MTEIIHNPDQYMIEFRTIVAQGRKRVGFLVGAGAAAGLIDETNNEPLIPAIAGLTSKVLDQMPSKFQAAIKDIQTDNPEINIEGLLSLVRSLSRVIGSTKVKGLDSKGHSALSESICEEIGKIVNVQLPLGENPYRDIVNWITGLERDHPVEIFTTNYDLLFEEAFETNQAPYFDGFVGGREPYFDSVAVANNKLPPRWSRLWKLHGSLGWGTDQEGQTIRTGKSSSTNMIFPEHQKYDRTQKAPFTSLFDRLQSFLSQDDTLLITAGFSFDDAHVAAKIDESLSANPSAAVFAFQYRNIDQETSAVSLARKRPNFSVYCPDRAMINGVEGGWKLGDDPTRDWGPIRSTYWGWNTDKKNSFLLGDFSRLCRFLALSRSSPAFAKHEPQDNPEPEVSK